MTNDDKGLYPKYQVYKIRDGVVDTEPVEEAVFVLNPATDEGARVALRAYQQWAERDGRNALARDLDEWLTYYE